MHDILVLGAAMLATGAVSGVLAGLLGIGGGIVIVPVLDAVLTFLGVDPAIRMHVAVATSLATIIPTSIASSRAHFRRDSLDLELARRWAAFILLGSLLVAWLASGVHSNTLAVVFAVVAFLMALKLLLGTDGRTLGDRVPTGAPMLLVPTGIGAVSSMMGIGGGTLSVATLTLFRQPIHRAVGTASLFGLFYQPAGYHRFYRRRIRRPAPAGGQPGVCQLAGFCADFSNDSTVCPARRGAGTPPDAAPAEPPFWRLLARDVAAHGLECVLLTCRH